MNNISDQTSVTQKLPQEILALLEKRDGLEQLLPLLREKYDPSPQNQEHIWDYSALIYSAQGRRYEALSLYYALYEQQIRSQIKLGVRIHKGTPLVRISDEHRNMGNTEMAKRYIMLTICEDAISGAGQIPAETTGTYFRTVWMFGISPEQLKSYAAKIWEIHQTDHESSRFPEWVLQEIDQQWRTEYPSSTEATLWIANKHYINWLIEKLGGGDGKALERLAHYLLSCLPGFRAQMRVRSESTDYDIVCAPEGLIYDFRSDLGRYFLCECKDWHKPADVTTVVKFASVLRSAKCCFGIIFTKNGITGEAATKFAERELLKIFQQDNLTILVISEAILKQIADGANFLSILRSKYEETRLDLPKISAKLI